MQEIVEEQLANSVKDSSDRYPQGWFIAFLVVIEAVWLGGVGYGLVSIVDWLTA